MTLEEIARAFRLNEKTIDRDAKSIADSFRARGIDLSTLNLADMKVVIVVIVDELQKKCPDGSGGPQDAKHAARVDPSRPESLPVVRRARLPRRFRTNP